MDETITVYGLVGALVLLRSSEPSGRLHTALLSLSPASLQLFIEEINS